MLLPQFRHKKYEYKLNEKQKGNTRACMVRLQLQQLTQGDDYTLLKKVSLLFLFQESQNSYKYT